MQSGTANPGPLWQAVGKERQAARKIPTRADALQFIREQHSTKIPRITQPDKAERQLRVLYLVLDDFDLSELIPII